MLLAIAPDVFHRVEFWRVCWQELQLNAATLLGDELPHQPAAMSGQAVPDYGQPAADVPLQVSQELDYLWRLDAAGEESEVEVPYRDSRHGRKALPVEGVLQHRRLAARRPGAYPVRALAQAAFIHEHYGSALLAGFFFISGQRTRFHRRIAGSSRWVARPTGRWQLQPSERSIRHTCPG